MRGSLPMGPGVTWVFLLVCTLLLSACTSGWSDQDFEETVRYCEASVDTSAGTDSQCVHSVTILRDDLSCPVDVAREFLDLASRLEYEGARAVLDEGCENPSADPDE